MVCVTENATTNGYICYNFSYFSREYMPFKWQTIYANIVLQAFSCSLFLYRNSFVHTERVNVSKTTRWFWRQPDIFCLFFLTKSFLHDCQVWFYFLQSHASSSNKNVMLTHWGRVTHICVDKLTVISSDNYLNQCCNIVNWILGNKLQWNLNRNSHIFIKKMLLKMSSAKWRLFCLGFNVLSKYSWRNQFAH